MGQPLTVRDCVFREPDRTVESILRECSTAPYLRGFRITREEEAALCDLAGYRGVVSAPASAPSAGNRA